MPTPQPEEKIDWKALSTPLTQTVDYMDDDSQAQSQMPVQETPEPKVSSAQKLQAFQNAVYSNDDQGITNLISAFNPNPGVQNTMNLFSAVYGDQGQDSTQQEQQSGGITSPLVLSFADGGELRNNQDFRDWQRQMSAQRNLDMANDSTYDYQSFYNDNPAQAQAMLYGDPNAHFTDRYKTAYHPTFSTESQYSGVKDPQYNPWGITGGQWYGDHVFKMSPDLEARSSNIDRMVQYIQENEPGGLVLLNSSGTLPLLSNGDYYGGVLPEVTVKGYANGGHLYDGTSEPSQQMNNYPNTWWTNIGQPVDYDGKTYIRTTLDGEGRLPKDYQSDKYSAIINGERRSYPLSEAQQQFKDYGWYAYRDLAGHPVSPELLPTLEQRYKEGHTQYIDPYAGLPSTQDSRFYWNNIMRNTYSDWDVFNAVTGGVLNWIQPSQIIGNGRNFFNALQTGDWGKFGQEFVLGNSGVVTDNFAKEHPYWATLANLGTDVAAPWAVARRFNFGQMANDLRSIPGAAANLVRNAGQFGQDMFNSTRELVFNPLGNVLKRADQKVLNTTKKVGEKVADSPAAKSATNHVPPSTFESELDWTPEGWFSTRVEGFNKPKSEKYPNGWTKEEADELASHVKEYHAIEQQAKADGTWLRMPDGSLWQGDPRSWVQMHSKDLKTYMGKNPAITVNGVPIPLVHGSPNAFDTFDISYFGTNKDTGYYGKGFYFTPTFGGDGSKILPIQKYGDKTYNMVTNAQQPFAPSTSIKEAGDFNRADSFNRPGIYDYIPLGPEYDAVSTVPLQTLQSGHLYNGASPGEVVVADPTRLKSLLGNTGNFSKSNKNFYRAIIPAAVVSGTALGSGLQ